MRCACLVPTTPSSQWLQTARSILGAGDQRHPNPPGAGCIVKTGLDCQGLVIVEGERLMSEGLIEGTLYIQSTDQNWGVSFVPHSPGSHGSTGVHPGQGDKDLVEFLRQLGILQERIHEVLSDLRLHRNVSVHPVRLPVEQIQRYGL